MSFWSDVEESPPRRSSSCAFALLPPRRSQALALTPTLILTLLGDRSRDEEMDIKYGWGEVALP